MLKVTRIVMDFDVPFNEGDRVYCNGELYKGLGTVAQVRLEGEVGLNDAGADDIFPCVVVKPDNTQGLRYGNRGLIRYNAQDLADGKLLPADKAPKAQPFKAEEPDAGWQGDANDGDENIQAIKNSAASVKAALDNLVTTFINIYNN